MQHSLRFNLRLFYRGCHKVPLDVVRSEMERVYMTSQMPRRTAQCLPASEIRSSERAAYFKLSFQLDGTPSFTAEVPPVRQSV